MEISVPARNRYTYSRLFLPMLILLCAFPAVAVAANVSSTKTGNWNDPTVWSSGTVPTTGDVVTIVSPHVVTMNASATIGSLTVAGTLQFPSTTTAYTLTFGAGSTITVNGTLDMGQLGVLQTGSSGTTTLTMGTSATLKTGNLTAAPVGALGPGVGASLQEQATGTFDLSSLASAGTVLYTATGGQAYAVTDRNYNTVQFSGAGNFAWAMAADRTIKGNLFFSSTSLTLSGAKNVFLAGNLNNTTGSGGLFNGGGATIIFNGTGAQRISSNNNFGPSFPFTNTNITINNGPTGSASISDYPVTLNGLLTVASGAFTVANSYGALTLNGSLINNGTVTYTNSTITMTGDFTNNGGVTAGTTNLTGNLTNNAGATLTYTGKTMSVSGTFTNSGTVNAGTATIGGSFTNNATGTVNAGTLTISGALTNLGSFVNAGSTTVAGDFVNSGSYTTTGTVTFNGTAAQSVTGNGFSCFNLAMNNAAGLTLGVPVTVTGTLTLQAGTLTAGSNLTLGNTASVNRYTAASLVGTPTFGTSLNVTYNFSASAPSISPGPEFPSATGILNNLTINGGTTLSLDRNIDPKGVLALSGATTVLNAGSFDITMKGNGWTNSASVTAFNGGTGTVTFAGTANATISGIATTFNNLVVALPAANTLTMTTGPTVNSAFTLSSGIVSLGANQTFSVKGDFRNNSSATAFTGQTTSTLQFNGTALQTVGGSFATTTPKLAVNNPAGISLGNNLIVSAGVAGALTLTSGVITTGANSLSLSSTAATVTRTSGWVSGNFNKAVGTGPNITKAFEVGDATAYAPVSLTFASITTPGSLTASTVGAEHPDAANSGLDLTKDVNRYWTVINSGLVFTSYGATLNYVAGDIDAGADPLSFEVRKRDAGTWAFTATGTRTTTSTQATGLTTLSDFMVGKVIPVVPTAPALISPANNAVDQVVTPTLSWNAVYGADSYDLIIATDPAFSNVVINQTGLTATSYALSAALANSQDYYWHVSATNIAGTSPSPTDWKFTTIIAIPPAPVLVSPADGAAGVSVTPTLTWNAATGAATYRVQIAADAGFASIIIDVPGIAATTYDVVSALGTTSQYYWRVNATNVGGTSPYSTVSSFNTIAAPPAIPTLLTPANLATNVSRIPTLTWNPVLGATSYTVEVATDAAFTTIVASASGLASASYTVGTPLNPGTVHYWHVSSTNGGGTSAFSGAWSFTTRSNVPVNSTKTGNWNDPTVWSTAYVPGYGDPVTIVSPHVVTMNASGAAGSLIVAGTLQFTSITTAYSLTFDGGSTVTINGTLDMGVLGSLVTGTSGTVTVTMGSNGTIKTSNLTTAPVGALGPGAGASLQTQGTGTFNLTSLESAGTVMYTVTAGQAYAISDRNYNTLFLSGAGNLTWAMTGDRTVKGNLQLSATSATLSGGFSIQLGGSLYPSVGTTFNGGGGTIVFNGTAGQTISYNDVLGGSFLFSNTNAVINKTAGLTVSTSRKSTFGGSLTVISGTLSLPSSFDAMGVNGAFVNNGTVSYTSSMLTVGGDFTNNGTVNGGTTYFNGSAAQAIGGSSTTSFTSVTIGNVAGVTLNSNINISGTLSLGANVLLTAAPNVVINSAAPAGTISGSGSLGSATVQVTRTAATADYSSQYRFATNTLTNITVEYAGSAAQTINALNYGGLKISNTVGATLGGNVVVQGNFTNNGVFNASTFGVTFSGTSAGSIQGASASSFAALTVSKGVTGLTLGANASVFGVLTLTNSSITTGTNVLTIESLGSIVRSTTGHVIGNLRKQVAAGANVARTFEVGTGTNYAPVIVTFANVATAGYLTGTTVAGEHPSIAGARINPARSVNRYWTLANDGVAFDSYDAVFNFVAGDIDAGAAAANFVVDRYNAPAWSAVAVGSKTANSTQVLGAASFSDFAIGEALPSVITVVASLTPFSATMAAPSAEQSYTVAGTQLTGNLTVTPPAGYELSLSSGTGFTAAPIDLAPTGFSIPTTTIYVRLSNAAPGDYAGNITHVSPGVTQQNLAVTGSVSMKIFLSNSATDTTARRLYPDNSWRVALTPPAAYSGADDWSVGVDQPITVYVLPENGAVVGAADMTFQWDASVLALQNVDFTGSMFSGPNVSFATFDPLGTANSVRINASMQAPNNVTAGPGSYLAKITFTLKTPAYTWVSASALDIRRFNPDFTTSAIPATQNSAELRAYLGDVATSAVATAGDGAIGFNDFSPWSVSYWSGVEGYAPGMQYYKAKYDIGPTMTGSYFSLPAHKVNNVLIPGPDGRIDFEDLVVFSMGYGMSQRGQLPKISVKQEAPIVVAVGNYQPDEVETRIPVQVSGGVADVRAMSLTLAGQYKRFLGVENGSLLSTYSTPVPVMSHAQKSRLGVDLAVMGLANKGLEGEGTVYVLRFEGRARVGIAKADLRGSQNTALDVTIKDPVQEVPASFALSQNYPNPFNPSTMFDYELPSQAKVDIRIYNILGEVVAVLVDQVQEEGYYSVTWNGTGMNGATVGSGVYFCRMQVGQFSSVKKMLLMK